jgi:hypothetical protein
MRLMSRRLQGRRRTNKGKGVITVPNTARKLGSVTSRLFGNMTNSSQPVRRKPSNMLRMRGAIENVKTMIVTGHSHHATLMPTSWK